MEAKEVNIYSKKNSFHVDRHYWPTITDKTIQWFYFQGEIIHTYNTITQHADNPILPSMLQVFSMFMAMFEYEKTLN